MRNFPILLLGLFVACRSFAQSGIFAEETFRERWDLACDDWPERVEGKIGVSGMEPNPALKISKEAKGGLFRILAKVVVEGERGESLAARIASVEGILRDGTRFPKWVMPGINENPDGGSYFVELGDLKTEVKGPDQFWMRGPYTFTLLWMKFEGLTTLQARVDDARRPDCPVFKAALPAGPEARSMKLVLRMVPRPEIIEWSLGEMWVLHREKRSELRVRLAVRPNSKLFSLMPEALMNSQLNARTRRLLGNLLEFRTASVVAPKSGSGASSPTMPKASR